MTLFVACTCLAVIGAGIEPDEGVSEVAPVSPVNTPAPPIPTAEPTPSTTEWTRFTPEQAQWVDAQMDKYINAELDGAIAYSTSPELRYSLCDAWEQVDWDFAGFVESINALLMAGEISAEDAHIMREVGTTLFGAVQGPNMDAYLDARRAGQAAAQRPPMPTMGMAYCYHNLTKP